VGFNASKNGAFEKDGRVWFRGAIHENDLLHFDAAAVLNAKAGARVKNSKAMRTALAKNSALMQTITSLDPDAKPVRVVAFNKTSDTNWGMPWHQDRVIAVTDRAGVQGFHNWTKKSSVWHCEPPQSVLDGMLFVRVHLDDTDATNGAMEIAVGSHKEGIIPAATAEMVAGRYPIESCDAKRGDVLVLKMLTLHGSRVSKTVKNRRVFRIDFAPFDLSAPLKWAL
tara:strand:- start:5392 stop:6066 length:675 start_codon:yes stop_codon:yes gene_type:complete